mmetsp:Transcript_27193/g.59874  ORF Transcript_27193/g.59874 Transcript_27193/m.59874 type:complete len:114 (-) Transcript_27193:228-569(-)|eukprot:CAMPEP_0168199998 /NCGR_PEP_ID=MMETSP0139_2-20121125/22786_1 /TAXON_ID=44445 /ORGANISM="Pseudo-nitzschia australis, Strain 10249 10 AB" /LENGTH=113 /DNA_ID=CAMNT_0008125153 /DNA_START=727 /DNA_END=1068 /DNA_ORIENTATION=+
MTAAEIGGKDTSPSKNKGKFKKGSKKEKASKPLKESNDKSDDSSTASTNEKSKNWLGQEMKRPRAEYQAEIDELKLKFAAMETDLLIKTNELNAFKDWIRDAPSANQESVELY